MASPYRLKSDAYSSHAVILGRLGPGRGRTLLDVGAADGFLSELLTRQGWRVTALERDPAQAERARGRCAEVVVADLDEAAQALSGPFDAIVYGDVLEHLSDPLATLVALNRALATDGLVIPSVPNVAHLWVHAPHIRRPPGTGGARGGRAGGDAGAAAPGRARPPARGVALRAARRERRRVARVEERPRLPVRGDVPAPRRRASARPRVAGRRDQTRAMTPPKIVVVMPAYNAGRTLRMTYEELPKDTVNLVILVDDGSTDATLEIARELGLEIFVHDRNYGYGANQKTCYTEALRAGCDVVVMVHPDYQYDPTLVPKIIEPILKGQADLVLGSRLKGGGSAIQQGMPWWKYVSNRFLTGVENLAFGLHLSEFHTGYRAFSRESLEAVNFRMNSDGFVFDQEIISQAVAARLRIAEIAVPVRYFAEASSASLWASCRYGLRILLVVVRYLLHRTGIKRSRRLMALRGRYHRLGPPESPGAH